MIGHPAEPRVHVCAAQFFGRHLFARGRFNQRRSGQKNGAVAFDDHGLIGHGRNIGAAGRAGTEDGGDLRDAFGRHARDIVEDTAEMLPIRKDVRL